MSLKVGMIKQKKNITEFSWLIEKVHCISDSDYQNRIWEKHQDSNIIDSYDDTTMYFIEDAESVIKGRDSGRIYMTDSQYKMLKKLLEIVENYDCDQNRPISDEEICKDPKWHEIREYAKRVYNELTSR